MDDLAHRGDPTRWSSLAESALVLTGIVPADPRAPLGDWLARLGGGISLTMFSAVPKGSGLGTSSILGAATIQCLDRVVGRERAPHGLFAATSALEQMLSTRGGWQDQVGGVLGGFKIARTAPGAEQRPEVEPIAVPDSLVRALRERSLLYFTGERRMAKNILENVVWNWLVHEPAAVRAVDRLRANAERMRHALASGDIDAVVGELTEYMRRKRQIDPGSCPKAFDTLAERWKAELGASGSGAFGSGASGSGASRSGAWCFAGAGGGGFMLLVARDADAAASLRARIERDPPHPRARAFDLEVDPVGLRCAVL
jgi:galactokinase/mevalonate kinase-like predicted kinase